MTTQKTFHPRITPSFVVRALHIAVPGVLSRPAVPFTAVITDSRKVQPGCLFVAIKGEKFDGHDFIETAIAQGARGILYRRGHPQPTQKELCLFAVEDTLAAYRRIAQAWRKEYSIPLVAVAGSVGKTTTKEILAAILRGRWPEVLKTTGSQNGFVGIPMTLLELGPQHGAAVVEVGIDEIGAMQQHMPLVGANVAVLTAIGPEHLEKLKDIPTVAREEGIALAYVARSGGTVAINLDDPWIKPHFSTLREGHKIPFSLEGRTPTSGKFVNGTASEDGRSVTITGMGLEKESFELPLPGRHNASNFMAAVSVALGLGLTVDEIRKGLATFKGADGRSEVRMLPGNTPVLCDYYNANPTSTEAGLELLSQLARQGSASQRERWACLGDMLELGPDEERYHRGLASKILELGVEHVLLYGPRMAALRAELETQSFKGEIAHFASHAELAQRLTGGLKAGQVVMIKGSRGMRMEEVWKALEPFVRERWPGGGATGGTTGNSSGEELETSEIKSASADSSPHL